MVGQAALCKASISCPSRRSMAICLVYHRQIDNPVPNPAPPRNLDGTSCETMAPTVATNAMLTLLC